MDTFTDLQAQNFNKAKNLETLIVGQFEIYLREIPRAAGENAGLRDDAAGIRGKLTHYRKSC
jgi:hypothetical protein